VVSSYGSQLDVDADKRFEQDVSWVRFSYRLPRGSLEELILTHDDDVTEGDSSRARA
jgi:hypothetical protein